MLGSVASGSSASRPRITATRSPSVSIFSSASPPSLCVGTVQSTRCGSAAAFNRAMNNGSASRAVMDFPAPRLTTSAACSASSRSSALVWCQRCTRWRNAATCSANAARAASIDCSAPRDAAAWSECRHRRPRVRMRRQLVAAGTRLPGIHPRCSDRAAVVRRGLPPAASPRVRHRHAGRSGCTAWRSASSL